MNELYLIGGIIVATLATFSTRVLPFVLFSRQKGESWLTFIEIYLPQAIMIILIFYSIKDVNFGSYPYGLCEIIGIVVAFFMHLIFKNALLSIVTSTAIYMLLVQKIIHLPFFNI